MIPLYLS